MQEHLPKFASFIFRYTTRGPGCTVCHKKICLLQLTSVHLMSSSIRSFFYPTVNQKLPLFPTCRFQTVFYAFLRLFSIVSMRPSCIFISSCQFPQLHCVVFVNFEKDIAFSPGLNFPAKISNNNIMSLYLHFS